MIRVNLLPHREEKRKARRQQFYALLGLISVLVGLIWFLGYTVINQYISVQEAKNAFIETEIKKLDKEIADAAVWIAKKGGVGGLIVIERDMQISAYIESGIAIDAVCNAPLLRTIFTKNTPLHDGAAIVRNGRIAP